MLNDFTRKRVEPGGGEMLLLVQGIFVKELVGELIFYRINQVVTDKQYPLPNYGGHTSTDHRNSRLARYRDAETKNSRS